MNRREASNIRKRTLRDDFNEIVCYESHLSSLMINGQSDRFEEVIKDLDDVHVIMYLSKLSSTQGTESRFVAIIKKEILTRVVNNGL